MAARRKSQERPTSLAALLRDTAPGRAAAGTTLTRQLWLEVAGVAFAKRTRPAKMERGTLLVLVTSAGWAQELSLHGPVLLERLRARGVEVEKMRFKVGPVEPPERGGVHAPSADELDRARRTEPTAATLEKVESLPEGGLRAALEKTARVVARRNAEQDVTHKAAAQKKPRLPGT